MSFPDFFSTFLLLLFLIRKQNFFLDNYSPLFTEPGHSRPECHWHSLTATDCHTTPDCHWLPWTSLTATYCRGLPWLPLITAIDCSICHWVTLTALMTALDYRDCLRLILMTSTDCHWLPQWLSLTATDCHWWPPLSFST